MVVTYSAGWNVAAFPQGANLNGVAAPLYTLQPGNGAYQMIQPSQIMNPVMNTLCPTPYGLGYWAFFPAATQVTPAAGAGCQYEVRVPAGRWIMVGDPSGKAPASVSGADAVYVYSLASGYQATTTLQPGQGAWVFSAAGAIVTVTPSTAPLPAAGQVACTAPGSPPDPNVADPNAPHDIFVLAGSQPLSQTATGQSIQQYLLNNPDVCGATVFVNWNLVDNGPGANPRYNWSVIDNLIAPWAQAGKIVNLVLDNSGYPVNQGTIIQGVPAWLQPQLETVTCGADVAPVYWQPAFVSNWQTYVAAVVARYSADPDVGYLHIGVATGAQTLVVGAKSGPCLASWDAAGYETQWPAYVQQMISFAGSLGSPKALIVSFNDYANYPVASQIFQWDAQAGIGTGFSGLQAADAADYASGQPCGQSGTNWCALYDQYAGKIPLFVQTLGQSDPGAGLTNLQPSEQAAQATGPLPPLLQTALATHTQIFEIYSADLLVAFDPSYQGYSQYHSEYEQALASLAATVGTFQGAPSLENAPNPSLNIVRSRSIIMQ